MTVTETGIVDWLGIEKSSGHVALTVVDDLDWKAAAEHLRLLEEKLNTYLAFIESGEVFLRLAKEAGREVPQGTPINVSILAKFKPSDEAQAFIEYARSTFEAAGFGLTFKVLGTDVDANAD